MKNNACKGLKDFGRKAAIGIATYYANVSCPLVVYQPKMKGTVKN